MNWNEIVTELATSHARMIFGHSVPEKSHGLEADFAVFGSEDGRQVALAYNAGNFEVFNRGRQIASGSAATIEAKLTKYRLTNFIGIKSQSMLDNEDSSQ